MIVHALMGLHFMQMGVVLVSELANIFHQNPLLNWTISSQLTGHGIGVLVLD